MPNRLCHKNIATGSESNRENAVATAENLSVDNSNENVLGSKAFRVANTLFSPEKQAERGISVRSKKAKAQDLRTKDEAGAEGFQAEKKFRRAGKLKNLFKR